MILFVLLVLFVIIVALYRGPKTEAQVDIGAENARTLNGDNTR